MPEDVPTKLARPRYTWPDGTKERLNLSSSPDAAYLWQLTIGRSRSVDDLAQVLQGDAYAKHREALAVALRPLAAVVGLTQPSAPAEATADALTWDAHKDRVIRRYDRARKLKPSTRDAYVGALNRATFMKLAGGRVEPSPLQGLPLDEIDGDTLSDLNEWLREHRSGNTAGQTMQRVRSVLTEAAEKGIVSKDPMIGYKTTADHEGWFERKRGWKAPPFELDDLALFLRTADEWAAQARHPLDPAMRAFFDLMLLLATREGELCGLLKGQVQGRQVRIWWQRQRNGAGSRPSGIEGEDWLRVRCRSGRETTLITPKMEGRGKGNARRAFLLPRRALEVIFGLRRRPEDLFLLTQRNGSGLDAKHCEKQFGRVCEMAGLPHGRGKGYTTHSLRRTTNVLLRQAAIDKTVRRSILGHAPQDQTDDYDGCTREDYRQAADALDKAWAHLHDEVMPRLAQGIAS